MDVGKRIRKLREKKSLEQIELAELVGISQSKMNKIETGYQKRIEPDILVKLANSLNVSTDYLMGNVKEDEFDPIAEHNRLLKKYGIEDSGFFDIEKWRQMGPEDLKQLEDYFEFIVSKAKEREKEDKDSD